MFKNKKKQKENDIVETERGTGDGSFKSVFESDPEASIPKASIEDIDADKVTYTLDDLIIDEEEAAMKNMDRKARKKRKRDVKRQKRQKFLNRFNWAVLRREIEGYGYRYSFVAIMKQMLVYFALVGAISYVLQLHFQYIFMLGLIVFMAIPIIIRAQYQQMYEIRRFQMVVSYLSNVIPIFKAKPVILHAWRETLDLVEGEMHEALQEAINYVISNTTDENQYETACQMIESHFPNSRIHAVHKMMLTVIRQNSKTYQTAVDNVFYDCTAWISRTFNFQKDLEDKKSKLLLLCLITLGANCLFIAVYSTNEIFKDFPQMLGYQVSTFIFVAILLILMCLFFVKMNGQWLVDDQTNAMEKRYEKAFNYMVMNHKKRGASNMQKVMAVLFVIIGVYAYLSMQNIAFLAIFGALAFVMVTSNERTYKSNRKRVQKALEMEFPIWLRDVALNLNNMTVLNAIENSKENVTPIFEFYIDRFLVDCYNDPTSIRPYNDFLQEYSLPDVKSSMKILYTLNSLDPEQLDEQVNSLIIRNQEMLAKAESMKNEDSVSGVTKFGFAPVGLFMLQMLISMVLMFMFMMSYMSSTMNGIGL